MLPDRDQLVEAYLQYYEDSRAKRELSDELHRLYSRLDGAIYGPPTSDAEAVDLVLHIVNRRLEDERLDAPWLSYVAAGPVEDILCYRGPAVVDELIGLARKHPRLRAALGGAWKRTMDDVVWEKVQAALKRA